MEKKISFDVTSTTQSLKSVAAELLELYDKRTKLVDILKSITTNAESAAVKLEKWQQDFAVQQLKEMKLIPLLQQFSAVCSTTKNDCETLLDKTKKKEASLVNKMLVNVDTYIEKLQVKKVEMVQISKKTGQVKVAETVTTSTPVEVTSETKDAEPTEVSNNAEATALWKRCFGEETLVYWSDFIAGLEREQLTFTLPQIVQRTPLEKEKSDWEVKDVQEPFKGRFYYDILHTLQQKLDPYAIGVVFQNNFDEFTRGSSFQSAVSSLFKKAKRIGSSIEARGSTHQKAVGGTANEMRGWYENCEIVGFEKNGEIPVLLRSTAEISWFRPSQTRAVGGLEIGDGIQIFLGEGWVDDVVLNMKDGVITLESGIEIPENSNVRYYKLGRTDRFFAAPKPGEIIQLYLPMKGSNEMWWEDAEVLNVEDDMIFYKPLVEKQAPAEEEDSLFGGFLTTTEEKRAWNTWQKKRVSDIRPFRCLYIGDLVEVKADYLDYKDQHHAGGWFSGQIVSFNGVMATIKVDDRHTMVSWWCGGTTVAASIHDIRPLSRESKGYMFS